MAEEQTQKKPEPQQDASMNDDLSVKVFSQGKTYFDDKAKTVSAQNQTGPFDVLSGHANFLSLVSKGEVVIHDLDDDIQKIPVYRGVLHVRNNVVKVFLDV